MTTTSPAVEMQTFSISEEIGPRLDVQPHHPLVVVMPPAVRAGESRFPEHAAQQHPQDRHAHRAPVDEEARAAYPGTKIAARNASRTNAAKALSVVQPLWLGSSGAARRRRPGRRCRESNRTPVGTFLANQDPPRQRSGR